MFAGKKTISFYLRRSFSFLAFFQHIRISSPTYFTLSEALINANLRLRIFFILESDSFVKRIK